MVYIEENSTHDQPREKRIHSLREGNEAQVLFVLLLTIRDIIDRIMYDHPRFMKEAISGPSGSVFVDLLDKIDRTDEQVAEYCMFVLRSDHPEDVIAEFDKVLDSIRRIMVKTINMEVEES